MIFIGALYAANIAFNISLMPCMGSQQSCLVQIQHMFNEIFLLVMIYTGIHCVLFLSAFIFNPGKFKKTLFLLVLASYSIRMLISRGFGQRDHSMANMMMSEMGAFAFFLVFGWFFCLVKFWIKGFRSSRLGTQGHFFAYKLFYGWICFWLSLLSYFYLTRIKNSCQLISRGLISMDAYSYSEGDCTWKKAPICWYYVTEGWLNPVYWGRDKCSYQKDDLSLYHKA